MAVVIDGTNGISTPDLESAGPVTGTTGTFSGAVQASGVATNLYPLVSSTVVASTSGTSIDFNSIPSWAKRITVMFQEVSTNGSSLFLIQLGTSGGVQTSSYVSVFVYTGLGASGSATTQGFGIYNDGAGNYKNGAATLTLLNSANGTWVAQGIFIQGTGSSSPGYAMPTAGSKTLSGTLDRIRITTVNGTDTFDAGSINIMWE